MKLFELWATLGLDTRGFDQEAKGAVRKGRTLGETLGTMMGAKSVVIGNIVSGVVQKTTGLITDLAKKSISIAASIDATNAQFSAAFGDLQGAAEESLQGISEATGILEQRYKSLATLGFSQLKGAGLDANDALKENERLLLLSADAAAYYDITVEEANERIRSFMRGNTEAGDMIGLFTSDMQRNEEAMRKYNKKWLDLTEAERELLMLDITEHIYAQSNVIGQAARESDSWQVATGNLAAAWEQVLGAFGKPIVDVLTPIVNEMQAFLADNEGIATQFGENVGDVIVNALEFIKDTLQWFSDNRDRVTLALGFIAVGFIAMQFAVNPIGASIKAVIAVIGLLIANWDKVTIAVNKATSAVKSFFGISGYTSPEAKAEFEAKSGGMTWEEWHEKVTSGDWYPGPSNPHASGLSYVPYDDYRAALHAGEAVLTRQQAEEWRKSASAPAVTADDIAAAVKGALDGLPIVLDGNVVGELITDRVSRNIAKRTKATRRYATV